MENREEILAPDIYQTKIKHLKQWILIALGIFLLTLMLNFSLIGTLENKIRTQLALLSTPQCELSFSHLDYGIFFPRLILHRLNLSNGCLNTQAPLTIPETVFSLEGLSFSPLGLKLGLKSRLLDLPIQLMAAVGVSEQIIRIEDQRVDLEKLSQLNPYLSKVKANLILNALINTNKAGIQGAQFRVEADSATILPMNVMTIALPMLDLGAVEIQGTLQDQTLLFELSEEQIPGGIKIGGPEADIEADFNGKLQINPQNFMFSQIALEGKVRFGQKLMDTLPIIKLFLGKLDREGEFYKMRLEGLLAQPQIQ